MLNVIESAILAGHVYHSGTPNYMGIQIGQINHNETIQNGWAFAKDVDPFMQIGRHFYAGLYIKFDHGEPTDAVVAIRGTIFTDLTNDATDAITWTSDFLGDGTFDHLPHCLQQGIVFMYDTREYLKKYFPKIANQFEIKITGHSLGGSIAKLFTLQSGMPYKSIAFNAPGCGHVPDITADNSFFITNINSKYGLINKIGETLGKIYLIDVPEDEQQAKALFTNFDKKDYRKSQEYYAKANSTPDLIDKTINHAYGEYYRVKSFTNTAITASDAFSPEKNEHINKEDSPEIYEWLDLQKGLAQRSEKLTELASKYIETITAQHSIDNMVTALSQEQNRGLAFSAIP